MRALEPELNRRERLCLEPINPCSPPKQARDLAEYDGVLCYYILDLQESFTRATYLPNILRDLKIRQGVDH
jgi:hypothetical protein